MTSIPAEINNGNADSDKYVKQQHSNNITAGTSIGLFRTRSATSDTAMPFVFGIFGLILIKSVII